jgi:hypothetical protein
LGNPSTLVLLDSIAHEVGHQWWYDLVGSDSNNDPWLDECLTEWSANFYLESVDDKRVASNAFAVPLEAALQEREGKRQSLEKSVAGLCVGRPHLLEGLDVRPWRCRASASQGRPSRWSDAIRMGAMRSAMQDEVRRPAVHAEERLGSGFAHPWHQVAQENMP